MLPSEINEASIPAFLRHLAHIRESLSKTGATRAADLSQDQKEWWILVRVMDFLLGDLPPSPVRLKKSERPDFILNVRNQKIALELTEVISPLLAEVMTHPKRSDMYSPSELFLDPRGLGQRRDWSRSDRRVALDEEIRKAADILGSPGAGADIWEKRLADLIAARVSEKNRKAKAYPSIGAYDTRILVLYDRASPAGTRLEQVIAILSTPLLTSDIFQRALLLSGDTCFRIELQPKN